MNQNRINVLMIEDNTDYNEALKVAASQDNNINLTCATNGIQGITKAMNDKPDIILLDIMMPQMSGFEVIDAIKGNSSLNTKIIILTNLRGEKNIQKAINLGAHMYLQKSDYVPFEVLEKVKSIFGGRRTIDNLKKVLIIEDDPDLAELLKIAFDDKELQTLVAGNGIEAISQAVEFRPDLIILDIMLPQMDGFEVLKALRQNANLDTVIIANTNIPAAQGKAPALELGADFFVNKSFYTPLQFADKALEMYTSLVKRNE